MRNKLMMMMTMICS